MAHEALSDIGHCLPCCPTLLSLCCVLDAQFLYLFLNRTQSLPVFAHTILSAQISFQIFAWFIFLVVQVSKQMSPPKGAFLAYLFSSFSPSHHYLIFVLASVIFWHDLGLLLVSFPTLSLFLLLIITNLSCPPLDLQHHEQFLAQGRCSKNVLNELMSLSLPQQPFTNCWPSNNLVQLTKMSRAPGTYGWVWSGSVAEGKHLILIWLHAWHIYSSNE